MRALGPSYVQRKIIMLVKSVMFDSIPNVQPDIGTDEWNLLDHYWKMARYSSSPFLFHGSSRVSERLLLFYFAGTVPRKCLSR